MNATKSVAAAALIAAAALTPSAAFAAEADAPELHSSPQMRIVDATHARLSFAADQLPVKAGKPDAGITIPGGRVTAIKAGGPHGADRKYTAIVTATKAMRDHGKYTMTFRLGKAKPVTRVVTLYKEGDRK